MLTLERAKELLNTTTTEEHLFLHAKNLHLSRNALMKRAFPFILCQKFSPFENCSGEEMTVRKHRFSSRLFTAFRRER